MRPVLFALASLVLALTGAAQAKVTKLEIASKRPYGSFKAGDYVRLDGRVTGELSPTSGGIPDLDKATRDADGTVGYSARVILFMPTDPAAGNGALLVDVSNRGHAYANALYNSSRARPSQSGDLEPGTGFLEDRGYAVAEVYWELGRGADLPSFTDPEGKRRFVEGTGFAIVRDAADFLAHAAVDTAGTPNPPDGTIDRVLAVGKSQDGRFLKSSCSTVSTWWRDGACPMACTSSWRVPGCCRSGARARSRARAPTAHPASPTLSSPA